MREIGILVLMLLSTVASWAASVYFPYGFIPKLTSTLLVLSIIYLFFEILIIRIISRQISDQKGRYTIKKVVNILSIVFFTAITISIWLEDPTSLLVTYSIIGAGIAFALQDVFKNFVGSIIVILSGTYRIGDRIEIDGNFGDVIDIGLMTTTLMEIRGWVQGDQASGRIVSIPNGFVINRTTTNYTRDHSFIWDEIMVPITYDSNWARAEEIILSIIQKETGETSVMAEKEIERLGEKYYLPKKVTEPAVYMDLTDNWISLIARFVADARGRRLARNRVSRAILIAFEKEPGITIASETATITIRKEQGPA